MTTRISRARLIKKLQKWVENRNKQNLDSTLLLATIEHLEESERQNKMLRLEIQTHYTGQVKSHHG